MGLLTWSGCNEDGNLCKIVFLVFYSRFEHFKWMKTV